MYVRLDSIRRREVVDATGNILGRVRQPLVDMETWLIDALRVTPTRQTAGELGLRWSWWRRPPIDIPTGQVQAAGDAILLRISLADLREATHNMIQLDGPISAPSIH